MPVIWGSQRLKGDIHIQADGGLAVLDIEFILVVGRAQFQPLCLNFGKIGTVRIGLGAAGHGKMFVKRPFNTCLGSRKADEGTHFFIGDESLELPCQIILVHGLSVDAAD